MNTNPSDSGNRDGVMQMWHDGVLVLDLSNRRWRGVNDTGNQWQAGEFTTWTGGNSQPFANAQDQSLFFDHFIWSTSPIAH